MARLGHARPVRPQILRGWIEFVVGDTDAPAGLASAAGSALQPYIAAVGVATAAGTALQPAATVAPKPGLGFFRPVGASEVSTPDHASFAVTDLDVTIRVAADDWTPAATAVLIGQTAFVGQVGWTVELQTDGRLRLRWSPDGTTAAAINQDTTNPLGFTDGTAHTLRVTLDVDAGGSTRAVNFYTDGVLLETFGGASTAIFNSNQALAISNAAVPLVGRVYSAELLSGINGTAVANPNFDTPDSPTQVTDSTGKVWTVSGSGSIVTGVPTATGSALQATVVTGTLAPAGVASATGSALQPYTAHVGVAAANGAADGQTVQTVAGGQIVRPVVATDVAVRTAQDRYRRRSLPTVELGPPLAQPETQAPAGLAAAAGSAPQAAVQTSEEPVRRPPVVVTPTAHAVLVRRRQPTAQFVDLGAPIIVEDTNAPAGLAAATGTANAATADIDVKPGNPGAAGASTGQTVITGTLANAGNPTAVGSALQPEAEIGAKPGNPVAAGASTGTTVETGTFANAPAGLASATGAALAASITIRPNAAQGLAAGLVGPHEAEIGAKAGATLAAGASTGTTVTFGALALAGLATATGTAFTGKADIDVAASVTSAAGVAGAVFGLTGNPTGPGQPVTVYDPPGANEFSDEVGFVFYDTHHAVESR
jgi:hypothetical protein